MKRIKWKQLNYLRLLAIAVWCEIQLFLIYALISQGSSRHKAMGTFSWQLPLLWFLIRATRQGPPFKGYFKYPIGLVKYYFFRTLAVLITIILLVALGTFSFVTINHYFPVGNPKNIAFIHFIGFSSAAVLAWILAEYLQNLIFTLIDKPE